MYFESAMVSENLLRTGIRKTSLQKSYKLVRGAQSKTITFNNTFKQFPFLEISLVFDRSDHHLSIYDSYNAEVTATQIKTKKLQNASNTYSEYNPVNSISKMKKIDTLFIMHLLRGWLIVQA